jgi:hypothetical protein
VRTSIRSVLQTGLAAYLRSHRLPLYLHRAAQALRRCRTAALGGHIAACSEGHITGIWYNSCRHRSCPRCAHSRNEAWLEKKRELLLPTLHYQAVFTLPGAFRVLWLYNRREMADLLFRCVHETLTKLLADPQWLGARPGMILTLQTWSTTLSLHPHIHCLITGGGLTRDGTWKPLPRNILLPSPMVRKMFRGKFLDGLDKLYLAGKLRLPPDWTRARFEVLKHREKRKKWNVRIEPPYEHGDGLALYLARYIKGGPIQDARLVGHDQDSVTFRYKTRDGAKRFDTLTLPMEEFFRRLLLHVPEPGQRVVRSYGLYHHHYRDALERCRARLPQPVRRRPCTAKTTPQPRAENRCRVCGRPVQRRWRLPRTGIPPPHLALETIA